MPDQLGVEGLITALRPALAHLATVTQPLTLSPSGPSPADDGRAGSNLMPAVIVDVQLTAVGIALLTVGLVSLTATADLQGYRLWPLPAPSLSEPC